MEGQQEVLGRRLRIGKDDSRTTRRLDYLIVDTYRLGTLAALSQQSTTAKWKDIRKFFGVLGKVAALANSRPREVKGHREVLGRLYVSEKTTVVHQED